MRLLISLLCCFWWFTTYAQDSFVYGDLLPDAPELAVRGQFKVGVETISVADANRIDILNYEKGKDSLYDRALTLEVWYPTRAASPQSVTYEEVMGNNGNEQRPIIPFTFKGRASRSAPPATDAGSFPLLIVSHGYTGSRLLFTYLTENLASKGYVVVSIDHKESTFKDAGPFISTLLNRSLDVLFVLDEITKLSKSKASFLSGVVDVENTALIGYSMGGYGVTNVAGAAYSPQAAQFFTATAGGSTALNQRTVLNANFASSVDPRIKAVVAFAPWGMQRGVWNAEGLAGIKIPSFFVAGSKDDISGYDDGIKAMYEGAVNSDRYLLTYVNARHNVAPNPPPPEASQPGLNLDEYLRYADSVWDQRRINNINQHFVTAFLGYYLKGDAAMKEFLQVTPDASKENWKGFKPRTSVGLYLNHLEAEEQ